MVMGRLEEGVMERKVRLEQAWVRSRHAVVVKTRDFILKACCKSRLLEEKEQKRGNKI